MSGLLQLLDLGAGALQAQNAGISIASNNTANVNTEGYSRQRVDLHAQLAAPLVGGVRVDDPQRAADELLSGRQRDSVAATGLMGAFADALLHLEETLASEGLDITANVVEVFASLGGVATSPLDASPRDAAVAAVRRLALSLRQSSDKVVESRMSSDFRVRELASSANQLAQEIADANKSLQIHADPVLRDQRDLAAMRLTELVGGTARIDSDGHMRLVLPNGEVIVDGERASRFETTTDPALGNLVRVDVVDGNHRRDVTTDLDGGKMGGELRFRDQDATQLLDDLDQFAFDLATQLNAIHRANAGLDGTSGRDLFVQPAAIPGAAAAFSIDAAVDGDSRFLASSGVGAGIGDNSGVLALLDLRDQPVASGGTATFVDESIRLLTDLGRAAANADSQREFHIAERQGIEAIRDSVSGVSVEEEMVRLVQFQHAAESSIQFISTVDELLGNLIQTL